LKKYTEESDQLYCKIIKASQAGRACISSDGTNGAAGFNVRMIMQSVAVT
jgi:hypothetical protein